MPVDAPYNPYAGCRTRARVWGAVVCVAALGGLVGIASLDPNPGGIGTHTQLGVSQCMWEAGRGTACPTCGYTTAAALAADGRLVASLLTQPAGMLLALTAAMAVWIGGWVAWSGSTAPGVVLASLPWGRTLSVIAVIIVASWLYKLAVS